MLDNERTKEIDFRKFKKVFEVNKQLQMMWTRFEAPILIKQDFGVLVSLPSFKPEQKEKILDVCLSSDPKPKKSRSPLISLTQLDKSQWFSRSVQTNQSMQEGSSIITSQKIDKFIRQKRQYYSTLLNEESIAKGQTQSPSLFVKKKEKKLDHKVSPQKKQNINTFQVPSLMSSPKKPTQPIGINRRKGRSMSISKGNRSQQRPKSLPKILISGGYTVSLQTIIEMKEFFSRLSGGAEGITLDSSLD